MASPSVTIDSTIPQAEEEWIRQSCGFYACPVCKQGLEPVHDGLSCRVCVRTYPIRDGIPDFIVVNLEESRNLTLHRVGKKDSRPLLNFRGIRLRNLGVSGRVQPVWRMAQHVLETAGT